MFLYTVDPETSRVTSVKDRCGDETEYEYDVMGRTTKVSTGSSDVSYKYNTMDNMTEIVRGDGMKYVLEYDTFHNLESIGIEGKSDKLISAVEYDVTIGNDVVTSKTKVVSIVYVYDNEGELVKKKVVYADGSESGNIPTRIDDAIDSSQFYVMHNYIEVKYIINRDYDSKKEGFSARDCLGDARFQDGNDL